MKPGYSQCALQVHEGLLNPNGTLHGGVVYTLADTGMGAAVFAALQEGESCATIEIKISYLRAVREGELRCETRVVHRGRRMAFVESEVHNRGRLVAKATGTFAIFD